MGNTFPPAWYDDPTNPGGKRWWDGTQWTQHTHPAPPPAPVPPPPPAPALQQVGLPAGFGADHTLAYDHGFDDRPARPWWQLKRVLLPTGFAVLVLGAAAIAGGQAGDGSSETATAADGNGTEAAGINQLVGDDLTDESDENSATSTPSSITDATSPSTVRPTTSTSNSATTETVNAPSEASTSVSAAASSQTTTTPTTAAPTTAAPTTPAPTTAAPTTAPPTTTPTTSGCHPAYSPCLPNLQGDALNCGELSSALKPVTVHNPANDPYGLDADNDGVGCEGG